MCLYSLNARDRNMRKAKVGENLTKGEYRSHGCFMGDDGKLACIKPGSPVEIAKLRLNSQFVDPVIHQPNGQSIPGSKVMNWNGRRVRGTFVQFHKKQYAADAILIEGVYI